MKLTTVSGIVPLSSPRSIGHAVSCTTSHVVRESRGLDVDVLGALLDGDIGAEVLLGDLREGAVLGERGQGLVGLLAQVGLVLAEGQRLLQRLVAGVARDLDLVVARGREVVEHRDVVVDDRVDPALGQQLDARPEVLDVLTFAPASWATCAQLLLAVWAVVRPSRSASVVMSSVSSAVTITPWEYVYGVLKR